MEIPEPTHLQNLSLTDKVEQSKKVVQEAFERFEPSKTLIAWTGGKDSTLMLWLIREVTRAQNLPLPDLMFINEGCCFEEVLRFKSELGARWSLRIHDVQNEDVLRRVRNPGDIVRIADLSPRNREEIQKLSFKEETFIWEPESYIGNHLMKTVAMNLFLESRGIEALYTGVRWDEQAARSKETFFSPRSSPDHCRIQPILHFKERDVWNAIHTHQIPVNPLYAQGYRSLGTKDTTTKTSNLSAWDQDLEQTPERGGRRQDKEGIMERLRELGYM